MAVRIDTVASHHLVALEFKPGFLQGNSATGNAEDDGVASTIRAVMGA